MRLKFLCQFGTDHQIMRLLFDIKFIFQERNHFDVIFIFICIFHIYNWTKKPG